MNWDALIRTFFNWDEIVQVFPALLTVGLPNTLFIALLAIVMATVMGMFVAVFLISEHRIIRIPARIYTDVFRGLPGILTVLVIGTGLPIAGLAIFGRNTYAYAALALAVINSAYIAEIFRSGIQSIERGQMEASRGLGLSWLQAMRYVIIPQGVRRILPALTNQFIHCIKDSALVYLLGLAVTQRELFTIGQDQGNMTGGLTGLVVAGMFYLALVIPMSYGVNWFDKRMREGAAKESLSKTELPEGERTPANETGKSTEGALR